MTQKKIPNKQDTQVKKEEETQYFWNSTGTITKVLNRPMKQFNFQLPGDVWTLFCA